MHNLMKIPKKRRHNSPTAIQAIEEFKQKLETTMVLWTDNEDTVECNEDRVFREYEDSGRFL